MNRCRSSTLRSLANMFCLAGVVASAAVPANAWQTAHGDPANSNSVDVRTSPAKQPVANVLLRDIAPGAAPVVAPNGTLYIADERGKLMSFSPDGTPGWSRDLGAFQSVATSPALGTDGSVYVVGSAKVRDHSTDPPTTKHVAELHRFTAGGGWLWHVPLAGPIEGMIHSPPNIIRVGGSDVIVVATGQREGGFEAFLTAFSGETGAVLAHQKASVFTAGSVTGGPDWPDALECIFSLGHGCEFSTSTNPAIPVEQQLPKNLTRPFPAVAVFTQTDSGSPWVFISDRFHDLVGYTFTGSAFTELMRIHDDRRYLTSAPLVWPNGPVMIGFDGPNVGSGTMFVSLWPGFTGGEVNTPRTKAPLFMAAPTGLGNSKFALAEFDGGVTFLNGAAIQKRIDLPGQSIAAAAASRTHVFVSTVTGLYTFNKVTMQKASEFAWTKGGTSQPVIGPQGHVYAIAQEMLYVFPPPSRIRDIPDIGSVPVIDAR